MSRTLVYPSPDSVWEHYKGGWYRVICVARDTEDGVDRVIYSPLGVSDVFFARPVTMWDDPVEVPEQGSVPRFHRQRRS